MCSVLGVSCAEAPKLECGPYLLTREARAMIDDSMNALTPVRHKLAGDYLESSNLYSFETLVSSHIY